MGGYVNFSNRVELCTRKTSIPVKQITFKSLSRRSVKKICNNISYQIVQIDEYIPRDRLPIVDQIFENRPDITLRVFGFILEGHCCDLSFLRELPHVRRLSIDCISNVKHIEIIKTLPLEELTLEIYEEKDFSIIQELQPTLKKFFLGDSRVIHNFDCRWLSQFPNLNELYLRKVKRNVESISNIESLKKLTLRGIKPKSWGFINETNINELNIYWCATDDLSELENNLKIRKLNLWRLSKLKDLDFISSLRNLEVLNLSSLSQITKLPDMSNLKQMKEIKLDNVTNLTDIKGIYQVNSLDRLEIINLGKLDVSDIKPLYENPNIKKIQCFGCTKKQENAIKEFSEIYHK